MRTNAVIASVPTGGKDVESQPAGAAELAALLEAVTEAERATARAVCLAGRVAGSGVCERVEGLPLEHFLGLAGRMTGPDRRMLVAAGEVLRDLPATAMLFADGKLSWGQVRGIVAEVRSLPKPLRDTLDGQIAETARVHGGVDGFDPDQLLDAVTIAAAELREPRSNERREQQRARSDFVALQSNLEGGLSLYGQCNDPLLAATVVNALDDAADQPQATDGKPAPGEATTRARQYAKGLGRICGAWLGGIPDHACDDHGHDQPAADAGSDNNADHPHGHTDTTQGQPDRDAGDKHQQAGGAQDQSGDESGQARGQTADLQTRSGGVHLQRRRPARPLLVAHIDIADLTRSTAATIELNLRGPLPTISLKVLEQLGLDADLRAVIFDGARPLAVSSKVRANAVPPGTRLAVRARDQGCRFPGSRDPIGHCDVHHLHQQARGGDHHPDNLVNLSRRHHTLVHRHGWKLTLDPATGEITASRGKRRWRSLPRATRLARAPNGGDGASHPVDDRSTGLPAAGKPAGPDPPLPF